MRKLQKFKSIIGAIVAIVFCTCLISSGAFAEGPAISITPSIDRISLNPGEVYTGKITIKNTGNMDYDFVMGVKPYILSQKELSSNIDAYTQIVDWITLSNYSGHLATGEKKDILYMVKTPTDTPAGGQYAIITAGFETETVTGAINASGAVGTVIYAGVAGETREGGSIQNTTITGFTLAPTIVAAAKLENTGNIDATANLTLVVKSAISDKEVYSNLEKPSRYVVLPDSSRIVDITWDGAPIIGAFNATFNITYLNEAKTLNKFIIICPAWFIFLISALIIAIVIRIVGSSRRRIGRRGRSSKFSL